MHMQGNLKYDEISLLGSSFDAVISSLHRTRNLFATSPPLC